jgi:glycosidase
VADQEAEPDSVLAFTRRAIALRTGSDDLSVGPYRSLSSPEGTWAFVRGGHTTVVVNMSDAPQAISALRGTVTLGTDRALEGTAVEGTLEMPPWSGAVLER